MGRLEIIRKMLIHKLSFCLFIRFYEILPSSGIFNILFKLLALF
jgi:hypothetical protein